MSNGNGHGSAASGDAAPHEVLELAAAAVRFVATKVAAQGGGGPKPDLLPDFTPETLSLVDFYVTDARQALAERPEAIAVTANAIGAYLGEVVRRVHGCWWNASSSDPSSWRLDFESVYLSFYPVQVAYALLSTDEDEAEQFSGFEMREDERDAVIDRLSDLMVTEEEYLLPSTRLEVLDIVVEALTAQQVADTSDKRSFTPEDYPD